MFRRATVSPTTARHVKTNRQALRDALALRTPAERELHEATSAIERVKGLLNAANDAENAATDTETAVATATRAWAEAGARAEVPSVEPALLDRMHLAKRGADEARIKATSAQAALPQLREAESNAKYAVSQTDEAIKSAIGDILLAEVQPYVAALKRARLDYLRALAPLKSLHEVVSERWGSAHPWAHLAYGANDALSQYLDDNAIEIPNSEELLERSKSWADFARRLASDPDATMKDSA